VDEESGDDRGDCLAVIIGVDVFSKMLSCEEERFSGVAVRCLT
jgi:hypothetical protein